MGPAQCCQEQSASRQPLHCTTPFASPACATWRFILYNTHLLTTEKAYICWEQSLCGRWCIKKLQLTIYNIICLWCLLRWAFPFKRTSLSFISVSQHYWEAFSKIDFVLLWASELLFTTVNSRALKWLALLLKKALGKFVNHKFGENFSIRKLHWNVMSLGVLHQWVQRMKGTRTTTKRYRVKKKTGRNL